MNRIGGHVKSISVFIPAYNDENTIGGLISDTVATLNSITNDWEIIVIDDCSPDRSGEIAEGLSKSEPRIKVFRLPENRGVGGAMRVGYERASKEFVSYTDGDAQYDIREIRNFIPYIEVADAIVGYRMRRADSILRRCGAFIYRMIILILFHLNLKDVDCSFKLIRKSEFREIELCSDSGFLDAELMIKLMRKRCRIKEVGATHYPRRFGMSQWFKAKPIYEMLKDALKM